MSLTITSTTASDSELRHAVSEEWRTPPAKSEEKPATNGDAVPLEKLPQKQFNEIRDQQARDNKDAARNALEGQDRELLYRSKGSGKLERRIDVVTKQKYVALARAEAAEKELADIKRSMNGNGAVQVTEAARPSHQENAPTLEQRPAETAAAESAKAKTEEINPRYEEAKKRYADFETVLEQADKKGVGADMSAELESAIKKMPNRADIVYLLAKSPELIPHLAKDPSLVAKLSADIGLIQRQANDPSFRRMLSQETDHNKRVQQALKGLPDAAKLSTVIVPVHTEVAKAVYEQPNSHDIDIYLRRNPALAAELRNMSIPAAIARVGRLAEQLDAAKNRNREKVRPPEPLSPVGTSATRSGLSLEELPIRDFIRERNRQERQHRR